MYLLALTLLFACGDAESVDTATQGLTCPVVPSTCDTPGSVISGQIGLSADLPEGSATQGDLWITLRHRFGAPLEDGGSPHWHKKYENVDLSTGPVDFDFDMCDGNSPMWSEEYCDYNLIITLDANANFNYFRDGTRTPHPDPLEPTALEVISLSCVADGPCLDIELDCTDGASCVQYPDPGECFCGEHSCSPANFCTER